MKWPSLQPWRRSRKIYSISKWPGGMAVWNTRTLCIQMQQNTHMHTHNEDQEEVEIRKFRNKGSRSQEAPPVSLICGWWWWKSVLTAAKLSQVILFLNTLAAHPLACTFYGGRSGDDNDINGCPKTSTRTFPYFVPWASVGGAWH